MHRRRVQRHRVPVFFLRIGIALGVGFIKCFAGLSGVSPGCVRIVKCFVDALALNPTEGFKSD